MNKVEIQLSKTKLLLGIGGSILFVVLGIWLFTHSYDFQNTTSRLPQNPTFIKTIGILGVLFFGGTGTFGIRKMFDDKAGLIIDDTGITNNTNASSIGLIKWSDITKIRTGQVGSTKFLLIYTKKPNYYLNKVKGFRRKLMEGNNRMYGTPLSITSNTLKCKFSDLEKLLNEKLIEQREKMPNR
ncbi:hypothetical protein DOS84_18240 [Flavobacterium aquariorum]|uniref:Uncharacterized protein n=1 Tax=Flavobacterium aquariorum TaxID=2217670 RepID=A0A2W7TQH4_9FLAO|nr:STM3941 family protein [Flavobacterium aquariorum]PZX91874.1 hypothetical protein DOS84_18240 [Flavobacterium aquariorum]